MNDGTKGQRGTGRRIIVIGGGAAGMMAAVYASKAGWHVLLL